MQSFYTLNKLDEDKHDRVFNLIFCIFLSLIIIIFALVVVISSCFTNIEVNGASMESTLHDGDILLAKSGEEVNRLDIIVIKDEKPNGDLLIKRAIALGGDTIKIEGGYVYLKKSDEEDFTKLEEDYVKDYGQTYYRGQALFEYTIPEGEIFYLGDNRLNSADSRIYGTCTEDQIFAVVEDWSLDFRSFNKFFINLFGNKSYNNGD